MNLYDEDFNLLDENDIDFETSFIDLKSLSVSHQYIVDKDAEYEERVVKEYPETGGKDVEYVCVSPEEGHWETRVAETGQLLDISEDLDEMGYDRSFCHEEAIPVNIWRPCTPEELEIRRNEKEQLELAEQQRVENEQLLNDMPDLLCAMYEENLQLKDTIDQQEEVLCAMYEELTQVKETSAIAYAESIRPY